MLDLDNITNSEIAHAIDEYIHNERDRAILKRRLIDGICSEPMPSVETIRETIIDNYEGSDFLRAIGGKDAEAVWHIMDEVMDTIRAFQPRLYDATLQKLNI